MKQKRRIRGFVVALVLWGAFSAQAQPIEITITGTPTLNLQQPLQISPTTAPTQWEYRIHPSQTGPEVAVQCEDEGYRFLEAIRAAGKQRWELVNFINAGSNGEYPDPCLIAVFKRPKQ